MRHMSWRPRQGAKLSAMEAKRPAEASAKYILGEIPKVFLYPVWGIVVAAFLTFSGRGELQLRNAGLLLVWLWLAVDLWAYLIHKDWGRWKFVIGWTITHLMLIGAMGIMWWWLDGKLQGQEEDVANNLSVAMFLPVANGDIQDSLVALKNNGGTDIGWYEINCYANSVQTVNHSGISHLGLGTALSYGETLTAHGDGQTQRCLAGIRFSADAGAVKCADITVFVDYSITTQPKLKERKPFRFIAARGFSSWVPEPINSTKTFCRD